jgi:carbon-monoxide dehydrogenase medium subunit
VSIDDFLAGPYETSLEHNEMLVEVRIPIRPSTSSAYAKVERRIGDWAVTAAGSAVSLDNGTIASARVGLTAVNADAEALRAISEALVGEAPSEDLYEEAGRRASQACDPTSDIRGSAEYKRHLAGELTKRTLRASVARVRGTMDSEGR